MKVSHDDMDFDSLEAVARELLEMPEYHHHTLQVSRQMHARKNPASVAVDAMERLMASGGQHLRPQAAYSLNFVQFYMLDVLLALYIILVTAAVVSCFCLNRCIDWTGRNILGPKDLRNKHKMD